MNTVQETNEIKGKINIESNISSLITIVDTLLQEAGHPNPGAWHRYLHPDAHSSTDLSVQRFLVNRCFRLILGNVTTENTMDARYCLVDTGEIKDWVRLFKTGVLPHIVRLNLP